MKTLKEINLSGNVISNVKDGAFDNLPELKAVHLTGNPITEYVSNLFD